MQESGLKFETTIEELQSIIKYSKICMNFNKSNKLIFERDRKKTLVYQPIENTQRFQMIFIFHDEVK